MSTPPLLHQFLESSAARHPSKVALVHESRRITYGQVNALANGCASFWTRQGLGEGARVAILLENGLPFVAAYYGTLKAGLVAVPLNPESTGDGLKTLLTALAPAAVICSARALSAVLACGLPTLRLIVTTAGRGDGVDGTTALFRFEQIEKLAGGANPGLSVTADRLANIIYTSGSSGQPKGVMLTHANIAANTLAICQSLAITGEDVQMVVLPFFYVMGLSLLNTHIAAGGRLVLNNRFAFAAAVLNQMVAEQVTAFSGVPSTYAFLLHRSPLKSYREKLTSLRYCSQAGGHLPEPTRRALRQALPEHTAIVIMYGATEAAARLTLLDPALFEAKSGSIGKPIPGVTVRVLDEQGKEVAAGVQGELVAQGPNVMSGYFNDPTATAAVLDCHGYHTGDLGFTDSDGFLYVTGRKDAIVKVGGHRINPREVEDHLMASGMLVETAVVAVPDELMGFRLVALAVPLESAVTEEGILAACSRCLPRHKLPAAIRLIDALPKSPNGKLDRSRCVELATSPSSPPA